MSGARIDSVIRLTISRDLALVLSGGGARGAYQVGFLRVLARECPDVLPGILTGVSAGGINAAYLAARQEPFAERVEELAEVWSNLHIDDVFRVDVRDLASRMVRWGGRLVSGGRTILSSSRSLVDTEPLRRAARTDAGGRGRPHRGHRTQPGRRLAAGPGADGVELHDRAVADLGARAPATAGSRRGSGRTERASRASSASTM